MIKIKEVVEEVCQKYDKIWKQRKRSIDSQFLISFIFHKITNKNKGYGITLLDLWDEYEKHGIKTAQAKVYAASSVCEARQKLPEDIFKELNALLLSKYNQDEERLLSGKHRVFAIDGTRLNLPRDMVDFGYKRTNKDAYYPQGLMSSLYNVNTQIVHDFCLYKHMNERLCAAKHLKTLKAGDVVIFDRGYFSYLMLHQCKDEGVHPIFRISVNLANKEIQSFLISDEEEAIVHYTPSITVKNHLKKQGYNLSFDSINLRLIKHFIEGELHLYGTTLMGQEYPKTLFGDLYHDRWNIEELYKVCKCLLNLEMFSAKSDRGLKQEIYAHFVLINLARLFSNASKNKDKNIKHNFKNCLHLIGKNIQSILLKSKRFIAKIIPKILKGISSITQRIRPKRTYKRISHKPFNRWVLNRSPYRS